MVLNFFKNNNKKGSAILLALIIMSAILSSALYINFLSIRAIEQSKNTDHALIAFYGAETGNEQAIYYLKKFEDLETEELIQRLKIPDGDIEASDSLVFRDITEGIQDVLIVLEKDQNYQLDLFDYNDLGVPSSIDHLDLSWEDYCSGNSQIELTVNEWEADSNINWGQWEDQVHINKCLLSEDATIDNSGDICSKIILKDSYSYQFRFKALNCDVYNFSIRAFDDSEQQLSFKNVYSINSVGEYPVNSSEANRQALRVDLRKFSPLSGLFDYVLFSEKSLIKDLSLDTGGWFGEDLFISTESLPDATQGISYSFGVTALNGNPATYRWSLSGDVPSGLTIDTGDGVLEGVIEDDPRTYSLIIRVESGLEEDSKNLLLKVNE